MSAHRRTILLEGTREDTLAAAHGFVGESTSVLWVSEREPGAATPAEARRMLGSAFDAVVLDFTDDVDADLLGVAHGFVWGGGALVVRMGPPRGSPRLATIPYDVDAVGTRFPRRLLDALRASRSSDLAPLGSIARDVRSTDEQAAVVAELARALGGAEPRVVALLSDRGRGKSSALGLAIRELAGARRIAVVAPTPDSAQEVFRFAIGSPEAPGDGPIRFATPHGIATTIERWDALVIDEAAQIPVPELQRIVTRHATIPIAMATTGRGYEGTGRGFVLRFLQALRRSERPLTELALHAPIRWDEGDPVERAVFDALLLDAEPSETPSEDNLLATVIDREELAANEPLLRSFFGLLVHAHYRTTPGDLATLLDAPNVRLHALRDGDRIAAASLVALEGGLPDDVIRAVAAGRTRIRGHALPDTLIAHASRMEAGALEIVRSVRLAVHPALRRRGLGARLVDHVHRSYAPDLFGTMFGATPELLRFRRSVGYALVRVGASRGARTGEPAAVMLRAASEPGATLIADLSRELARELPLQLELLASELTLDPALDAALREGLPAPRPLGDAEARRTVEAYLRGPRTFESAAGAILMRVREREAELGHEAAHALVRARVLERRSWSEAARRGGYPSVPAAMRALRRALRDLLDPPQD
ncbi:MAG: GNAT family N-acetyltransferase [Sandaracinaceae bacterium]